MKATTSEVFDFINIIVSPAVFLIELIGGGRGCLATTSPALSRTL
jgi:hypothetical protein